jgi:hypothetical protein
MPEGFSVFKMLFPVEIVLVGSNTMLSVVVSPSDLFVICL